MRLKLDHGQNAVIERSPLIPGSGFDSRQRLILADEDPVTTNARERAKTLRINMSAAAPLVMAARAYGIAARLPEETAVYALLIAKEAMHTAEAASPDLLRGISFTALAIAERRIHALVRNGVQSNALASEAEALKLAYPSSAFFARSFLDAADGYESASLKLNDPVDPVWRAWGVAISRFAASVRDPDDFQLVSDLLVPEASAFAAIFGRFLSVLTLKDAEAYANRQIWASRANEIAPPTGEDAATRIKYDRDFLRLMATIGRPDMALPFLVSRLETERDRPGRPLEREYLLRLGAFTRDLCHHISFRLSAHGSWERLTGAGYDPLLDFLDNFHPEGRLTTSGEVILPVPGTIPYPATDPEEDCAVMLPASGIFSDLPNATNGRAALAHDFIAWVREAAERESPKPSLAPYMKLAYLDWFAFTFEPLKQSKNRTVEWKYARLGLSTLTEPEYAYSLTQDARYHPDQRRWLATMLMVQQALTRLFGSSLD